MIGNTLFCNGVGCLLKTNCQLYQDGQGVDSHAPGYSWISCCDEEDRDGYMPMKQVK